ncbi:ThiF family adenylyltransferase [Spirulina sp. 06S082]|uniref:ThiF family adenylyltransferase n=1 Tax=Spirulina sp. 06S082 TaxID=3110248 RepID=UPI002B1EA33E|nr:ThiF family adenylyltransferase [Spirulina sp. 06S082]MEA5470064.1 ThiF family adenylyltransferase [Spirulina sp. 06S082]
MKHLTYDFLNAKPLVLPGHTKVSFVLVGCGGNGSWLAATICRLARVLAEDSKQTEVIFIDPDTVEEANIGRQNFCTAEIGFNKAKTLALRYSLAWGIAIAAIPEPFDPRLIDTESDTLTILIGCVDNAAARTAITRAVELHQWTYGMGTYLWWLDCGNWETSGQVLLGSHANTDPDFYQFHELGCHRLPAPNIQHPDLLVPQPEELDRSSLSCEELIQRNRQSLGINQRVAAEAAEYLIQLTTGKLKRFATYFDLSSGAANSLYTTRESVLDSIRWKSNLS